jgi:CRISPR/Cas system-associated endonuclease Cas3-HD
MKLLIISHDSGKLLKVYQEGKKRNYRHEVISAYVVYKFGPEIIKSDNYNTEEVNLILSNVVLLHHENIILSIYAGKHGERLIPLSVIRKMINNYKDKFKIECNLKEDQFYERVKQEVSFLDNFVEYTEQLFKKDSSDDIYQVISEIILKTTSRIGEGSLVIRNKVAALLHLLNVVDSVAANKSRNIKNINNKNKDSGNWIAKRALDGAELIDENKINCGEV